MKFEDLPIVRLDKPRRMMVRKSFYDEWIVADVHFRVSGNYYRECVLAFDLARNEPILRIVYHFREINVTPLKSVSEIPSWCFNQPMVTGNRLPLGLLRECDEVLQNIGVKGYYGIGEPLLSRFDLAALCDMRVFIDRPEGSGHGRFNFYHEEAANE